MKNEQLGLRAIPKERVYINMLSKPMSWHWILKARGRKQTILKLWLQNGLFLLWLIAEEANTHIKKMFRARHRGQSAAIAEMGLLLFLFLRAHTSISPFSFN